MCRVLHLLREPGEEEVEVQKSRCSKGATSTCDLSLCAGSCTCCASQARRKSRCRSERRGSLFQTDPQERTKPNEASSDDAPSTHAYTHTQTQTYTDTDTKTDAHPERRSMIEEGGSRKKSSREVKGDRCQKEEVTLDHHWMS